MGNCGVGFAPVKPGDQDFLIELMEGVEDIPGAAGEGIDWQWESFPEYLDALEAMPRAIDVATQVPHGAIRAYVMGDRCNSDYAPTREEVDAMAALVREGVEAGALGFSSSKTLQDIMVSTCRGLFRLRRDARPRPGHEGCSNAVLSSYLITWVKMKSGPG